MIGFREVFRGLIVEENAGLIFYDGFQGPARAVGDGGAACGRNLEGSHAEIFFAWKEEGFATRDEILDIGVGGPT